MLGEAVPKWLESWKGDGIIARVESMAIVNYINERSIPTVDLRGLHKLMQVPLVETNDVTVVRMAFEHLTERGFTRFGYCGFDSANYSRRRRTILQGMLAETSASLATMDSPNPHTADTSRIEASGLMHQEELSEWLVNLEKPIGIIACNDVRALQL